MVLKHVHTIIQSGNVIVNDRFDSLEKTAQHVTQIVERSTGIHSTIVARTKAHMQEAVDSNPFIDQATDNKQLHVVYCATEEDAATLTGKLDEFDFVDEAYACVDDHVFLSAIWNVRWQTW